MIKFNTADREVFHCVPGEGAQAAGHSAVLFLVKRLRNHMNYTKNQVMVGCMNHSRVSG